MKINRTYVHYLQHSHVPEKSPGVEILIEIIQHNPENRKLTKTNIYAKSPKKNLMVPIVDTDTDKDTLW